MAALSQERNTREVYCNALTLHRVKTIAANKVIYTGSICAINAGGNAVPASDTANLTVIGRAESLMPGGKIVVKTGVFLYDAGTSTEALTAADINRVVYVVDDHTVGKVGGTNAIPAGILRDITESGEAVVEIGTLGIVPAAAAASAD